MDQKPEHASSPKTNGINSETVTASNLENYSEDYLLRTSKKYNQNGQAELYSSGYPTPLLLQDLDQKSYYHQYVMNTYYNWAICGFGVDNFMSYAAYFCKNEAINGTIEVISVGSGDGTVDRSIREAYQALFGTALNITLVDNDPKFEVDYASVNELIKTRPDVVKNCVSLIIWPEPQSDEDGNDGYDIESIRKLQPQAVLIAYEPTGISGSEDLVNFLSEGKEFWEFDGKMYDAKDFGLQNYMIETVAYQEVHIEANKNHIYADTYVTTPGIKAYRFRMVKLKRTD